MDTLKYKLAARHSVPSILGFARVFSRNPGFAVDLFRQRWEYFNTRRFGGSLLTPEGGLLETPDMLIAYWTLFVEGELSDRRWMAPLKAAVRPNVVDVGANAGMFSLLVHSLNRSSRIVAFEPLPAMQTRLGALKERTGMDLTCHPLAVSDSAGEVLFESPSGFEGVSHISTSAHPTGSTFRVKTTTLDAVVKGQEILLMKIDVEGFECQVLAGGKRTLENTRYLIIEAHTPEHLRNITTVLGGDWRCARLGPADFLFSRG